jgi:hypothetical protein
LIGGLGTDPVFGGGGDDILIGGTTTYDGELDALLGLLKARRSQEQDYKTRLGALRAATLTLVRVLDDGENDILHGQQDLDWFWAFGGDNFDRVLGETVR